ncbi:MAG: cytochrome c biogenesis protein/redoxin [Chloroflexota bacterium]|nr:MAG: hypothetical protein DIU68_19845 [Chloroflexota bacterium]
MEPTIGLAFLAGLLSFVSPCVLPLVPAYIGYMGGRLTNTVAARAAVGEGMSDRSVSVTQRFVTVLHGLAFIAGFTFIFVILGLLATAFIFQIGRQNLSLIENLIARVGGLFVIFFGLHFTGILPRTFQTLLNHKAWISSPLLSFAFAAAGALLIVWALIDPLLILPALVVFGLWLVLSGAFTTPERFWTGTISRIQTALYSEVRLRMTARGEQSFASSALMGVVFAAGWTPCIGPVYGAVLTMAANGGDVGQAGVLLGAYSLGLGLPFLLAAMLLDSAQGVLRRIQRHMHTVELATGTLLIVIGVLVASGQLQRLSANFAGQFTELSVRVEECVLGFATGQMPFGDVGPCLNGELERATVPIIAPVAGLPAAQTNDQAAPVGGLLPLDAEAAAPVVGSDTGQQAPNFEVVTDTGERHRLSDLRGEVVLLNFWATWCGPCRTEMPEFERAYQEHGDDGLTVLAVNNRETPDKVAGFREEMGVTFPLALDETGDIQTLYGVRQYPTTLVINRDGIITTRHVGPLTAEQIDDLVQSALS